VTGRWAKLHNKGLYDFYSPPNIIRMIKSTMRWAQYVTFMVQIKNTNTTLIKNLKRTDHLENLLVERNITTRNGY
jgi:hypothetical protein